MRSTEGELLCRPQSWGSGEESERLTGSWPEEGEQQVPGRMRRTPRLVRATAPCGNLQAVQWLG